MLLHEIKGGSRRVRGHYELWNEDAALLKVVACPVQHWDKDLLYNFERLFGLELRTGKIQDLACHSFSDSVVERAERCSLSLLLLRRCLRFGRIRLISRVLIDICRGAFVNACDQLIHVDRACHPCVARIYDREVESGYQRHLQEVAVYQRPVRKPERNVGHSEIGLKAHVLQLAEGRKGVRRVLLLR